MNTDTEAGPGLNARVATEVLRAVYEPRFQGDTTGYYHFPPDPPRWLLGQRVISEELPGYSEDMRHAGELLHWMVAHGSSVDLAWDEDSDAWICSWVTGGVRNTASADKDNPALAICLAALLAVVDRDKLPYGSEVCRKCSHAWQSVGEDGDSAPFKDFTCPQCNEPAEASEPAYQPPWP